ncbi:MAG: hypothetical protein U5J62_01425 [Desulfurivibrio sp.]|nr:hypothetical protein [Desulfurivibrio sp.]
MMAAVAAYCRQRQWPCQVSLETMMACGFAACLGCAVKTQRQKTGYLHACQDGPVFAAEEISWD